MRGRFLFFIIIAVVLTGCSPRKDESAMDHESFLAAANIQVSSESLNSGRWDDAISSLPGKSNLSPQISFSQVPEAGSYCIYMLDESAGQWEHWISYNLEKTDYAEGEIIDTDTYSYVGPYPPKGSGDHTYTIYVFALKGDPDDGYPSKFDVPFIPAEELYQKYLNISDGKTGNVLGYGYLSGSYSSDI